ncbi:hypothetical protein ACJZ2D_010978 [Fusarium nematophilum]
MPPGCASSRHSSIDEATERRRTCNKPGAGLYTNARLPSHHAPREAKDTVALHGMNTDATIWICSGATSYAKAQLRKNWTNKQKEDSTSLGSQNEKQLGQLGSLNQSWQAGINTPPRR